MKETQQPGGIQDVFNYLGFGRYQFVLLTFLSFCWMADSVESQVGVLVSKIAHCDLAEGGPGMTKYMITAGYAGQAVGAYLFGWLSDKYGRKMGILVVALTVSFFGFVSVASQRYQGLIALRFFVGLGLGGLHVAVTLLYEMVPSGNRHIYICVEQIFFSIGGILISVVGFEMIPFMGRGGWRYFLIVAAAPTTIACLFYPVLLESPRWLISKNRLEQAKLNLYQIHHYNKKEIQEDQIKSALQPMLQQPSPSETENIQSNGHHTPQEIKKMSLDADSKSKYAFRDGKRKALEGKTLFRYLMNTKNLLTFVILLYLQFAIGVAYYGSIQIPVTISSNGREPFECDYVKHEVVATDYDYINQIAQTAGEIPGQIFVGILMFCFPRKYCFSIISLIIGIALIVQAVVVRPEFLYASWEGQVLTTFQYITRSCCLGGVCIMYVISNEVVVTGYRSSINGLAQLSYEIGATIAPLIVIGMIQDKKVSGAFGLQAAITLMASILVLFLPFDQGGKDLIEENNQGDSNGKILKIGKSSKSLNASKNNDLELDEDRHPLIQMTKL